MKYRLLFIFSLLACLAGQAQVAADSIKSDSSVSKVALKPLALFIGVDYGKLGTTSLRFDTRYEFEGGLFLFENIQLLGAYGFGNLQPESAITNGSYRSEGNYWRGGLGVLKQIKPESKLGLSLQYGSSTFEDSGDYQVDAENSGESIQVAFNRTDQVATWWEIVLTSESWVKFNREDPKARINRLFALGFHVRLRRIIDRDIQIPIDTRAIPGYGNVLNENQMALNIYFRVYPF